MLEPCPSQATFSFKIHTLQCCEHQKNLHRLSHRAAVNKRITNTSNTDRCIESDPPKPPHRGNTPHRGNKTPKGPDSQRPLAEPRSSTARLSSTSPQTWYCPAWLARCSRTRESPFTPTTRPTKPRPNLTHRSGPQSKPRRTVRHPAVERKYRSNPAANLPHTPADRTSTRIGTRSTACFSPPRLLNCKH